MSEKAMGAYPSLPVLASAVAAANRALYIAIGTRCARATHHRMAYFQLNRIGKVKSNYGRPGHTSSLPNRIS
jgi:hypothetical protein